LSAQTFFVNGAGVNSDRSGAQEPRVHILLLSHLYLLELCIPAVILSCYQAVYKADLVSFLFSTTGLLFLGGTAGILWAGIVIVRCYRATQSDSARSFSLTVAMNVATVFLLVTTIELTLRLLSTTTIHGPRVASTLLLPREWNDILVRYSQEVRKVVAGKTYFVYDELLGWTIGSNRAGRDGLYASSAEGIRSPQSGVSYKKKPAACRIALVGDSFAFGDDVTFEESWGHQLELALHSRCQVLNFGVPGYGVDQTYLRYIRDVRSWNPDIIVFGLINDDIYRTLSTYAFLIWPDGEIPFAKPRFVINGDRLSLQNVPTLTPEQIFSRESIRTLPHIQLDVEYHESEWDRPAWRLFHHSYLFRFVTTLYPRWEKEREETSYETLKAVNRSLVKNFVQIAQAEGSVPLVVYFPEPSDYQHSAPRPPGFVANAIAMLGEAEIPHIDLTPCIAALDASKRFAAGGHYTSEGNRAVAACLHDVVSSTLIAGPRRERKDPVSSQEGDPIQFVPLHRRTDKST